MAKKQAGKKVNVTSAEKGTRPVRLDLTTADHERLARLARRYGLSKSSYVRMSLFKQMEADEAKDLGALFQAEPEPKGRGRKGKGGQD